MHFSYKFEKILNVKSREKDEASFAFQRAVSKFEEVAEKLYHLLKKKETIENEQLEKIQSGLPVQQIRFTQQYLMNLQKEIHFYQQAVIRARQHMQYEEQRLLEKNVEVKKYEKLKEKDFQLFLQMISQEELKIMDEISTQATARGKL